MKENNYEIKNILVPTDFSVAANNSLKIAAAMAFRHKATIHLFHCISQFIIANPLEFLCTIPGTDRNLYEMTNDDLMAIKQDIEKKYSVPVLLSVEVGGVAEAVSEYLKTYSIDLVVMGSHGTEGSKNLFIGSNTMAVIKKCICPVLSIPLSFAKSTFDKVLYPMRNVNGSVEKYDYLKPILEKNNASVHLLGIVQYQDKYNDAELLENMWAVKKMILNNQYLVTHEIEVCENISKTILNQAEERNDDLIVINSTLDKKWYNFFSEAFTQQILNHSKVPVLCVKPELIPEYLQINFIADKVECFSELRIT